MSTTIKDLISTPITGSKVIVGVDNYDMAYVATKLYTDSLTIEDSFLEAIADALNIHLTQPTYWKVVALSFVPEPYVDDSYHSSWSKV